MQNGFVHLHVHTQYSLLEGALHLDKLIDRAKEFGMPALAITDTHNLFGAVDFFKTAKAAGIKPIIGCELLYSPQGFSGALADHANPNHACPSVHHLVVLCKNQQGYQNLCQLLTQAYLGAPQPQKGQPSYIPRTLVSRELLNKYGDGLIVLSGCLRGEIATKILYGQEAEALETVKWFKNRFKEDFYLEIQMTGIPEQDTVNQKLAEFAQKNSIELVATCDCHYLEPKDAESHEVLQCIEHGRNLDYDRPKSLVPHAYDFKSQAQMESLFEAFPEAISNTVKIAEKCVFEFIFKDKNGKPIYHLPDFRPDGVTKDQPFDLIGFFKDSARAGLAKRFKSPAFAKKIVLENWTELQKPYHARLEDELAMIERTGFAGYFLIVADFIAWAKQNGIPVGPGRGSGAGSLVAYSLGITDIDPIEFKLLFERFINPERISMPDFDIDFCQDRRGEVIDYVNRKYGSSNVSQIITFGKLQARAVVKDVGRVLGFSFGETDQLTKLFPDELGITLEDAILKEPRLTEAMERDPKIAKWMDYARTLEGLYRNAGIHAAGIIITENPLVTYCPLFVGRDGGVVIQYDKDSAEAIGLIKFDFLGLKTLTVIDHAVKLIRANRPDFTIEEIDTHDLEVFALFKQGDTDGVFQVESSGMKDLCMRIGPTHLEDLTAINALFRPGPLGSGMVDDFIDRKHGRKPILYDVPALESILKDTYGVILYQEQVMQIARELAGYSLGQADLLRRAMGKKKADEMATHREIFVKGATGKGLEAAKAEAIFDLMAKFAEYGFNKSHSAAYGLITYQTAFLKTHYPAPFMAALMTTEMDNTEKLSKYIGDCRAHGIKVLSPDVNHSDRKFSVDPNDPNAVRYGLEAIKGVGGSAVDAILEARAAGPFKGILDFVARVSTRKVNKKVLESLIIAGAFDAIDSNNRPSLLGSIEGLLEYASHEQAEKELGQDSLFDAFQGDSIKPLAVNSQMIKQEPDWPLSKRLALERQIMGFYLSGHPMEKWQKICETWLGWSVERIKKLHEERKLAPAPKPAQQEGAFQGGYRRPKLQEIKMGAVITEMREVVTKKGNRMAICVIEDMGGKMDMLVFSEAFQALGETLKSVAAGAEPLVITAELDLSDESPKLLGKGIELAESAHKGRVQQVTLVLPPDKISVDQLRALKKSMIEHRGKCPVRIKFEGSQFITRLDLPRQSGVSGTPQMVESLNQIFGMDVVRLN